MMKSILLSIKPKYVELIASGQKTIEVRKTAPQEEPFKCYIYETKGQYVKFTHGAHTKYGYGRGKVIGEFICDKVDEYHYDYCDGVDIDDDTILETAIDREDINIYAKGKTLYGWHISDLKIYDKPRELSEFFKPCDRFLDCCTCRRLVHNEYMSCDNKITRPPLSWCYVEDLGEEK